MKKRVIANAGKGKQDAPPRKLKRRRKVEKPKGQKRGFYLRSGGDIRRLLSRLISETYRGEIEESLLRCVAYAATVFLKSVEVGDFEKRLDAIEKRLKDKEKKGTNI